MTNTKHKGNIYEVMRSWFNFSFENPEKIKPNHSALLFYILDHFNRHGWKEKTGVPTSVAMEAIGIKSYNTYVKTLNDLIDFGFIKMVQKSKNQYTANIIALSNFNKALNKALDKAHTNAPDNALIVYKDNNTSKQIDNIDSKKDFAKNTINSFDELGNDYDIKTEKKKVEKAKTTIADSRIDQLKKVSSLLFVVSIIDDENKREINAYTSLTNALRKCKRLVDSRTKGFTVIDKYVDGEHVEMLMSFVNGKEFTISIVDK